MNHQLQRVDAGDLARFRSLLGELPRQEFAHLTMTRYEDSFTIHTNARRGWLMYCVSEGSGLYTRDLEYTGDPSAEEFFHCECGIDMEFKAVQTLPRAAGNWSG